MSVAGAGFKLTHYRGNSSVEVRVSCNDLSQLPCRVAARAELRHPVRVPPASGQGLGIERSARPPAGQTLITD
ncbi:hypothetical protein [Mycobacterium sp. 852002-51057_SCH5723018]|uniref:hypothetical protein n=1 Tax=Mycobacterium sp. 852002-51057_SCH5723018 TaxID=1834094 RepID=UPI0012E95238|nr:hypothetical protein [Mycobacterium sp. 852002-51057_SCH5723018]